VFGYAPACDAHNPYAEFGLDRPDVVSPYAAALLTMTGDPRTLANFNELLDGLPRDGRPLADGINPRSGQVECGVARILDQGLMFLSLNADTVRSLARKTSWYSPAERRLQSMDRNFSMPNKPKTDVKEGPEVATAPMPAAGPAAVPASTMPQPAAVSVGPEGATVTPTSTTAPLSEGRPSE
jgi:hypothetical protein